MTKTRVTNNRSKISSRPSRIHRAGRSLTLNPTNKTSSRANKTNNMNSKRLSSNKTRINQQQPLQTNPTAPKTRTSANGRRRNAMNIGPATPIAKRSKAQSAVSNRRGQKGASLGVNIVSSDNGQGVTVMRIIPNTAAEQMGLHRRDRITSLNGEPVRSVDQFISDIRGMQPGQQVKLGIVRDGNQHTISGELQGYAESIIQTQGPHGTQEYRRFQGVIEPNQPNEYSSDEGQLNSENRQAGYEESGQPSAARSGDFAARLSRIEQQIDRLSQQVDQLREAVGPTRLSERPGQSGTSTDSNMRDHVQPNRSQQSDKSAEQPNNEQPPSEQSQK